ncbi:MAG: LemA family protein [Planctomycetota bacterium]
MPDEYAYLPWLGLALGGLCLIPSLRAARRKRLVDDLPTSKTTGVFIGLSEVKGTAEAESPLVSVLAGTRCVHYGWGVEERWSRIVTEHTTDSQGRSQTRTRHESGWTSVASGGETIPFYLQDDEGAVRVDPEGAKIEAQSVFDETCGMGDPLYYGKGPPGAVSNSDHVRRFHESAIPLHAPLYVMGQARERRDAVAAEIAADPSAPIFLVSTRAEKAVSRGFLWRAWLWGVFGLIACGGFIVGRENQRAADFGREWFGILAPAFCFLAVAGIGWLVMAYNSLVNLRERVRQAWSQVDVQLKRRADLIPRLVEVVTGMRDHEKNVQSEVAALRAQLLATPPGSPGPDPRAAAPVLRAIIERYPELKSVEAFRSLQQSLSDTEQRIALARGYFNDIAAFYNTRLEIIPDRFIARLGGMQPRNLMAAADFERTEVKVSFAA